MALSAYLRDKLLDHYLRGASFTQPAAIYASLHTADTSITGLSEVAGGSYARVVVTSSGFSAASSGSKASSIDIDFAGMPSTTITYAGIWDALTSGNFLVGGPLGASRTTTSGDTLRLSSGQFIGTLI